MHLGFWRVLAPFALTCVVVPFLAGWVMDLRSADSAEIVSYALGEQLIVCVAVAVLAGGVTGWIAASTASSRKGEAAVGFIVAWLAVTCSLAIGSAGHAAVNQETGGSVGVLDWFPYYLVVLAVPLAVTVAATYSVVRFARLPIHAGDE